MLLLVSGSTKTMRRLKDRWPFVLGHLLTPANHNSVASLLSTGLPWAVDNGAFGGFDSVAFRRLLKRIKGKPRCKFVVCPDKVADAKETLVLWDQWKGEVEAAGHIPAFVFQDGQEDLEVPYAGAYFIGGSTAFKLSRAMWELTQEVKLWRTASWLHMGRVNSRERMRVAYSWGCDSLDGSSASKFGDTYIDKYCRWLNEMDQPRPLCR